MSQYKLDIRGEINLSDYSNISDYIELIDFNDSFTVVFDKVNDEDINIICSLLQEKNCSIYSKTKDNGKVYLSVIREA
ncbi:MAG: hypothetical protein GX895_02940 [Clostridiales bacterium]|uniref:hypothetical protein n=1 Tax=Clostridium sp. N3C TaxID=1776758 RepID=UPI00092DEFB1|nr:hypothetical protein [Clostridium sp. N3C]NLZ47738.1 hypothetical protein [Clostridiales bacterium]SCN23447.1 hypothetical protein N3C_1309 [Clostridium sp. N3C]